MPDPRPARVALVTGASRGIGRHLAHALAGAGVHVGVLARDADALAEVADEILADTPSDGAQAHPVTADVTDAAAVVAAVEEVERVLGGIDLLVNNAGVIDPEEVPLWEADPGAWWQVLEVDVLGPFHCARAVVPGMLARGGGRVVNLNSGFGTRDRPICTAYAASKAALSRIGGGLHAAGYDRGLRTFELAPGVVRTQMTKHMSIHADRTEWSDPEDVATVLVAIARGELDGLSGKFIRASSDDLGALQRLAVSGLPPRGRTLGLLPWRPGNRLRDRIRAVGLPRSRR